MNNADRTNQTAADAELSKAVSRLPASSPAHGGRKKPISMHEGIAVWCDCCSCEAEPYWVEIAQDMGIDLGSDYEDADR